MSVSENLTYLQKNALKGEIALVLSTSNHDSDLLFRIYMLIKKSPDEYRDLITQAIKESVTLDNILLNRVILETQRDVTPVWLWVDKVVADVKEALILGDQQSLTCKLSINKRETKRDVITSAFSYFCRNKVALCSPISAEKLLNRVLEEHVLDFLHPTCVALKDDINMIKEAIHEVENNICEEILDLTFDIRDILSFKIEMSDLETLDEDDILETLENSISKRLVKLSKKTTKKTKKPSSIIYVVKKIYKGSKNAFTLKKFKTKEEATQFVKEVQEKFPDLENTCTLEVMKETK